jgi:hypothetical protein
VARKRDEKKVEALAQEVARGSSIAAGAKVVGLAGGNRYAIAELPEFIARVAAIRAELPWVEGRDVGVLLGALKRAYDGAMEEKKYEAVARIVAEAAKLRKERPHESRGEFAAFAAEWGAKS